MSNFSPYAPGYNPLNAIWCAKAAQLAYANHAIIQATAREWEFDQWTFVDVSDTQAFMLASNDLILLAFRGTEPACLRDWMTDAEIIQVPGCGRGLVHHGFLQALNHSWDEISAKLKQFCSSSQPLIVTGHSLGAALATLAVAKLRETGQPVSGLYTFGSPRVGDQTFADWFNQDFKSRAFRFVNNNDLVTRVPMRSLGYSHVGTCLYFDAAGKVHNDIQFWNRFLEDVKGGLNELFKPGVDTVKDHDMGLYEKNALFNVNAAL